QSLGSAIGVAGRGRRAVRLGTGLPRRGGHGRTVNLGDMMVAARHLKNHTDAWAVEPVAGKLLDTLGVVGTGPVLFDGVWRGHTNLAQFFIKTEKRQGM